MQLEKILQFFAGYIERELGIVYSDHNYFQLQSRLEEIAKLNGVSSLEELYTNAQSGIHGAFKQLLLDVATNNETSFFRDHRIFKAIENQILAKAKHGEKLKIWSAASSTGQEALSLAILIEEYCLKNKLSIPYQILATDISERVLTKARSGIYLQLEVQRGLPTPYLLKYFKKETDDRWTANPEILGKIEYKKMNLKNRIPFRNEFQLILCRNVLIYQRVEAKKEIISSLTAALADPGFLVLGSGESIIGLSNDYEQVSQDSAIMYLKKMADVNAA